MVRACECRWTREQAKGPLAFLLAEKARHEKDIHEIEHCIERIRIHYNLREEEIEDAKYFSRLFAQY
ncbi:MAG: hypothetical protein DRN64_04430 [Thaumarchaeota archaeon]|nr:MAG: hypothetical protein DRN64_04430 [Nitrososphaerota archaeon]